MSLTFQDDLAFAFSSTRVIQPPRLGCASRRRLRPERAEPGEGELGKGGLEEVGVPVLCGPRMFSKARTAGYKAPQRQGPDGVSVPWRGPPAWRLSLGSVPSNFGD